MWMVRCGARTTMTVVRCGDNNDDEDNGVVVMMRTMWW